MLGAVVIGLYVSTALYSRYHGELLAVLRVYRLEEGDKLSLEKAKVESSFQTLRGTLVATAQSPEIAKALSNPGSNRSQLNKRILPMFSNLGATGLYLVTGNLSNPSIETIGTPTGEHSTRVPELSNLFRQMSDSYPTMASIWLQYYPATITSLPATPDPSAVSIRTQQSFVYAIPVFDRNGKIAGLIAASLDSNFFISKLSGSDRAIVEKNKRFVAYPPGFGTVESFWSSVQKGKPTESTLLCEVEGVDIPDSNGKWIIWTARFDSDFWSRADVATLRQNLVASVLSTWALLCFGIILVIKIRRKQEDRFQGLLRNSSEIILLCDERGEITQVGGQTRQLIGWNPQELFGVNLSLFLVHASRQDLFDLLARVWQDSPRNRLYPGAS